ncbi:hypothetical protein B0H19DRAFT_1237205 [Mycena capillaripes]|nr:hypothetical protein B0H19DRAFT_1237205 [Mycena capillaripes]
MASTMFVSDLMFCKLILAPTDMAHVINMCRDLSDTIAGDSARIKPLSESAVINFFSSLYLMHSTLSQILDHVDRIIATAVENNSSFVLDNIYRTHLHTLASSGLPVLSPFYRELDFREMDEGAVQGQHIHERLRLLRIQAHEMVTLGARELAHAIRYLPEVHHIPVHWITIYEWAQFCAEDAVFSARVSDEGARDLQTLVDELKLLGYSLDVASSPRAAALIERLEAQINKAITDMLLPLEGTWMGGPSTEI